jgi:hypothetical protein
MNTSAKGGAGRIGILFENSSALSTQVLVNPAASWFESAPFPEFSK